MTFPINIIITLGVVAIWSETFISSKILLSAGLSPATIFTIRFTIAYLCMIAISHGRLWASSLKHEVLLMLLGVSGGSLYFLTENMALKYSTASNVAILVGTTPLVTAILLACFYKDERLTTRQVLCSLLAFVGLVLVVMNGQTVLHLNPFGDMLALGASLTWGFYSLIMKYLSPHYDARFITRKVFAYGLITILPWFAFAEPFLPQPEILLQTAVWGNLLYLGLIASMLCFVAWNWVLPRVGIVKATNIIYTQSFFTMIFAAYILHERITLMAIIGTAILILGMAMMNKKA